MQKKNTTMSILTGTAMILVVLGHIDWDVLSLGGLFPYYSYHVMIFVFVSGYFYKTSDEENVTAYIGRKAKHLLLPYFIWNIFYGILSTVLAQMGFIYCSEINLYNFFIEPFLGGHQYGLNFASWFVPALFLIEMLNIFMRKICGLLKLRSDWFFAAVTLVCGMAVVYLAAGGHVWGLYRTPGRILFMLPVFEFGRLYASKLEKHDTLSNPVYFILVLIIQLAAYTKTEGAMNFSAVWCSGFTSLPFMPYLTVLTGTALWLRISRLISGSSFGSVIAGVGDSSFQVMMHHVTVFFAINLAAYGICSVFGISAFDIQAFKENVNYVFTPNGLNAWKIIYVSFGILLPVCLDKFIKNHGISFL